MCARKGTEGSNPSLSATKRTAVLPSEAKHPRRQTGRDDRGALARTNFHPKRWKLLPRRMKVGPLAMNGDQNRASMGALQPKVHPNRAKIAHAEPSIAVDGGKRALLRPDFRALRFRVHLNEGKFLPLREKFRSIGEKFLPIRMKLRSSHPAVHRVQVAADGGEMSFRSPHAPLLVIRAGVSSLEADAASPRAGLQRPRARVGRRRPRAPRRISDTV